MKKILLILNFCLVATLAYNQNCEPTVAYNFNGNTIDVSANDNDAVLFSGASTVSNYLEIGYNDDDRAEIPAAALYDVEDFTVTFEFYLNGLNLIGSAPTNTFIAGASNTNEAEFAISYQADIEAVVVALKGSGEIFPISLSAENWYCLTVTREGNLVTVYIDGVEISATEMSASNLYIEFLEIGQELDCVTGCYAANQSLNGRIENFSIYPCVLDNSGCQPFIAACDTTLFYKFDGNVLDDGVYANHGTLNAGAAVDLNSLEIGYNDDDYVEVPINALDGITDFAISFNFYLDELNESGSSPTNTFIAGTDGINMHEFALSYEASSNAFEIAIHEVGGIIPFTISTKTWYCATFYRSADSVWMELDGTILPTTLTFPEGPLSLVFLEIGQELDCPDGCFAENQSLNGRMDNILIQSCTDQLTCNEPSLSINASTNFTLEVYPNPANTNLIINLPVAITIDELLLYSITGQQIHPSYTHTAANQLNIDLSNLSSGLYFLQVKSGEMRWGVEIVVGR